MKWVVDTSAYNEASGGSIALHKLAHQLCLQGEEAYLTTKQKRGGWLGGYVDALDVCLMDGVMILPEMTVSKIWSGIMPIVRWILLTPPNGHGSYPPDEMIYLYSKYYQVASHCKVHGILGVYDFKRDFFVDEGRGRSGVCHTFRKGVGKEPNKHPVDSEFFDRAHHKSDAWLKELFNTKERFVSYDDVTMLSLFAAMCGCESVVVPGPLSAEEWRERIPYLRYGVAYGTSRYEISRAYQTLSEIPANLERLEKESELQISEMIQHVKEALC
jgi:hypothetical protein